MLMRYLLLAFAVIALVVATVLAIGWSLPVRHTVSRQVSLAAPADTVFALISRFEDYPRWRTGVSRVEMLSGENERGRFREHGSDGAIEYEISEHEPSRRLVTRIADTTLPFGGQWVYEITPADDGTNLRITENGEVYNPVFRFVSRFVMGHTRSVDRYLRDVTQRLGERA